MPWDFSMYGRQIQADQNAKMLEQKNMVAQRGGNTPAAIQIANEMQKALQSGDIERYNMLALAAKTLPKGMNYGENGAIQNMPGVEGSMYGQNYSQKLGDQNAIKDTAEEIERRRAMGAPIPTPALQDINNESETVNSVSSLNDRLKDYKSMLEDGRLDLGPAQNIISSSRNFLGESNQNSVNYGNFRADLERLRNESLRLNKGVQTEGDSQRAWNELMGSLNDSKMVASRLENIMNINNQAVSAKKSSIGRTYENYGRNQNQNMPPNLPPVFDGLAMPPAMPAPDAPPVQGAKPRLRYNPATGDFE